MAKGNSKKGKKPKGANAKPDKAKDKAPKPNDAKKSKGSKGSKKKGKNKTPLTKREMELAKIKAEKEEKERQQRQAEETAAAEKKLAMEMEQRSVQLVESEKVIQTYDKWVLGKVERQRELQEWKTFKACRNIPDLSKLNDVNSYLSYWLDQMDKPLMKKWLRLSPEFLQLIAEMQELLQLPPDSIRLDLLEELGLVYRDMVRFQKAYLDKCTYSIIEDLSELSDPEVGICDYLLSIPEVSHFLWGNLFQCPDINEHEFKEIQFKFRIPENLLTAKGIYRLVKTEYDHFSDSCMSYYAPGVENALKQSAYSLEKPSSHTEITFGEDDEEVTRSSRSKSKKGNKKKGKGKKGRSKSKGRKGRSKDKKGKSKSRSKSKERKGRSKSKGKKGRSKSKEKKGKSTSKERKSRSKSKGRKNRSGSPESESPESQTDESKSRSESKEKEGKEKDGKSESKDRKGKSKKKKGKKKKKSKKKKKGKSKSRSRSKGKKNRSKSKEKKNKSNESETDESKSQSESQSQEKEDKSESTEKKSEKKGKSKKEKKIRKESSDTETNASESEESRRKSDGNDSETDENTSRSETKGKKGKSKVKKGKSEIKGEKDRSESSERKGKGKAKSKETKSSSDGNDSETDDSEIDESNSKSESKSRSGSNKSKGRSKSKGKKGKNKGKERKSRSKSKGKKGRSKSRSKSKGKKGKKNKSKERPKTEAELAKERERAEKAEFIPPLHENELNLRNYAIFGGVYNFHLFEIPSQPKARNHWIVHLKGSDDSLKELGFEADYVPPTPPDQESAKKQTPEEMEKEAKRQEEELTKLVLVDVNLVPDISTVLTSDVLDPEEEAEMQLEREEQLEAEYEANKEKLLNKLITVEVTVPRMALWFEPPIPVRWDSERRIWATDGFHDIKFNENNLQLSFRTVRFGTIAFGHNRWSNLPYQSWELKPLGRDKVSFSLIAAMAVVEFIVLGDLICVSSLQNVTNSDIVERDILNIYMKPKMLIKALRIHGLDLFPEIDSYAYVDGVLVKHFEAEDHLYQCMALVGPAFNFQWSRWNLLAGREKMVYQMRERHGTSTPSNYSMVLTTPKKTIRINCTEVSPNYTEEAVVDFEYYADLLNLVRGVATDQGLKVINQANPHHVEALRVLLSSIRPITFS